MPRETNQDRLATRRYHEDLHTWARWRGGGRGAEHRAPSPDLIGRLHTEAKAALARAKAAGISRQRLDALPWASTISGAGQRQPGYSPADDHMVALDRAVAQLPSKLNRAVIAYYSGVDDKARAAGCSLATLYRRVARAHDLIEVALH